MNILKYNFHILLYIITFLFVSCGESKNETNNDNSNLTPIEQITEDLKSNGENAELYYQRAKLYSESQSFNFAIDDLEKAITLDDSKPKYHHLLADIYLDNAESRMALDYMTRTAEKFPEDEITQLKLAEFQLILQRYMEALETLNKYINNHPGATEAFFMKGLVYEDMDDNTNAAKNYRRATELDAQHVDSWNKLGELLTYENNPVALQMFENALRTDPKNKSARLGIPLFYHRTGQLEKAITEYLKVIEDQPSEFPPHYNLGLVYLELDFIKKAYQTFDIAIKAGPNYPNAYYYKGFSADILGEKSEARELYEQALRIDPNYEEAQLALEELEQK